MPTHDFHCIMHSLQPTLNLHLFLCVCVYLFYRYSWMDVQKHNTKRWGRMRWDWPLCYQDQFKCIARCKHMLFCLPFAFVGPGILHICFSCSCQIGHPWYRVPCCWFIHQQFGFHKWFTWVSVFVFPPIPVGSRRLHKTRHPHRTFLLSLFYYKLLICHET